MALLRSHSQGGNEKVVGWFVSQVKATNGKANPGAVNELLLKNWTDNILREPFFRVINLSNGALLCCYQDLGVLLRTSSKRKVPITLEDAAWSADALSTPADAFGLIWVCYKINLNRRC